MSSHIYLMNHRYLPLVERNRKIMFLYLMRLEKLLSMDIEYSSYLILKDSALLTLFLSERECIRCST